MTAGPLDRATLAATMAGFGGHRVLVVGDLMLDEHVEGPTERVSQEAPVPVVRVEAERRALGGAANVAHQLAVLRAHVDLVGVVGDDEPGTTLLRLAAEAGIGSAAVVVDPSRPTTRKVRVSSGRQQIVRVDHEVTADLAAAPEAALLAALERLDAPEAVVVSDYGKGVVTPAVLAAVLARANAWGVPCLVDPRTGPLDRYAGATVVKANRREFEVARTGAGLGTDLTADAALLRTRTEIGALVVTLGPDGMLVAQADDVAYVPSEHVEVADVAGAGDTALAVLALGTVCGLDLPTAAAVANAAAGAAVRKLGVNAVTTSEVLASGTAAASGPLPRPALLAAVEGWRAEGRRIVLTNGCFDLLHPGHVHLLAAAASYGDALVVAVNSDRSIRELKGEGRPVVAEDDRVAVVAALGCVDAVVVFDELTPIELIEAVRPDVLVKGADYTPDQVAGADLVEGWGGRVELVPLLPGHSTTDLISRTRDA